MLEIFALIFLTRKIGEICEEKGHRAGRYKVMAVVLWLVFEAAGVFVGIYAIGGEGMIIYLYALIGAIVGASISFVIAKNLKPIGEAN